MRQFNIYWLEGKKEIIQGNNLQDAYQRAGIGKQLSRQVDFTSEVGKSGEYEWNSSKKTWELINKSTDKVK